MSKPCFHPLVNLERWPHFSFKRQSSFILKQHSTGAYCHRKRNVSDSNDSSSLGYAHLDSHCQYIHNIHILIAMVICKCHECLTSCLFHNIFSCLLSLHWIVFQEQCILEIYLISYIYVNICVIQLFTHFSS